jgi:hypothetical protein
MSGENQKRSGFALVATVLCSALLLGLALAILGLAASSGRSQKLDVTQSEARENARLALALAIGQLQETMGPDTRVSASSGLVTEDGQRHWTGVWDTHAPDGLPWVRRDPTTGGLIDQRTTDGYRREEWVMRWLVSGNSGPDERQGGGVSLVGGGSVEKPDQEGVVVPAIQISREGRKGRLAWWTGDLGQRANLASHGPGDLDELTASRAVPEALDIGPALTDEIRNKLVSDASLQLWIGNSDKSHFHDFTTSSRGLLTDARDGGFKKDLGAFSESDGEIEPLDGSPSLSDSDRLAGPGDSDGENEAERKVNPFRDVSPRFGALRRWARTALRPKQEEIEAIPPETFADESGVLANLRPARLASSTGPPVQPVLVEASQFYSYSWSIKPGPGPENRHLRKHLYPRVTLWNPYQLTLITRPMMVLIQITGRHDFWIDGRFPPSKGKPGQAVHSPWVTFDGGRSRDFTSPNGSLFQSPGYCDPHMGSSIYRIPATRFGPGECLMFSPAENAIYRNGVRGDGVEFNLNSNLLSAEVAPDPSRCFTIPDAPEQPGFGFIPSGLTMETCAPFFSKLGMGGLENPADDLRVILKDAGEAEVIDVDDFDRLPQLVYRSGSLQYGSGREPVAQWQGPKILPIENTTDGWPRLTPDGRTREGLRLRRPDSGNEALLANWNPRAVLGIRSPLESLRRGEGHAGFPDGPWGFGMMERFVPTADASWNDGFPVERNDRFHGKPPVLAGKKGDAVAFALPGKLSGVFSLGFLQHACLSDFAWHPSRTIGNSLADIRVPLPGTLSAPAESGGCSPKHIGWSSDVMRSSAPDSWKSAANDLLHGVPEAGGQLLYDLSFEVNQTLWDRYFVGRDLDGRLHRVDKAVEEDADFHGAASHLHADGAFNVNSLSVSAWTAILAGTRLPSEPEARTFFRRIPGAPDEDSCGLLDEEIQKLAHAMVAEIRQRGPFLGLSDFVNRRLAIDETGRCGALEAAINAAGLNRTAVEAYPLRDAPMTSRPPEIGKPLVPNTLLKPASTAWGQRNYLTQADILQTMGNTFSSRSDTFVIRAYGQSSAKDQPHAARAWCEAVVQRMPNKIANSGPGAGSKAESLDIDFGRRFEVIRFRWLSPDEI